MDELDKEMMVWFSDRQNAVERARASGRAQRDEASRWCLRVVVPVFDRAQILMRLGGRVVHPKVYAKENADSWATFQVTLNDRTEFTYDVKTVIDPEGPKVYVRTNGAESKYYEPTLISDIGTDDLLSDLVETYKTSHNPIPSVM
jgi:hypothetical protein